MRTADRETTKQKRGELRTDLLLGASALSVEEAIDALEAIRETKIRPAIHDWDAQRSILRPAMIETFVRQRITDSAQWYTHIPQYLRTGTNSVEKTRFLEEICEIIDRIGCKESVLS
jgi:hypothetical protein